MAACEPPETCQDGILGPLDPEQCQVLGEGCVCTEGTILHRRHSALCIPEDKCGRSLPSPVSSPKPSLPLVPPLLPKDHGGGHFALPGPGLGVVHVWMRGILARDSLVLSPCAPICPHCSVHRQHRGTTCSWGDLEQLPQWLLPAAMPSPRHHHTRGPGLPWSST